MTTAEHKKWPKIEPKARKRIRKRKREREREIGDATTIRWK